jgi:hypothetical protein
LEQLKISQLRKRASEAGASAEQVEEADDSDFPKGVFMALIVELEMAMQASTLGPDTAKMEAELRLELERLKASQLRKRASEAGASAEQIEEAEDSESQKDAFMVLIVQLEMVIQASTLGSHALASSAADIRIGAFREELQGLKLMGLQRRAAAEGVTDEQLESALDSRNPKGALIELLVSMPPRSPPTSAAGSPSEPNSATAAKAMAKAAATSSGSRPHFGSGGSSGAQAVLVESVTQQRLCRRSTKHVMLSYQWDHQIQVQTRIFQKKNVQLTSSTNSTSSKFGSKL